jgi:hypothetical protein
MTGPGGFEISFVFAPLFCYYDFTHGSRFPKPLLLSPVEHLRRVSLLVSDLSAQLIQKTHP